METDPSPNDSDNFLTQSDLFTSDLQQAHPFWSNYILYKPGNGATISLSNQDVVQKNLKESSMIIYLISWRISVVLLAIPS